jgi:hypothetical protein
MSLPTNSRWPALYDVKRDGSDLILLEDLAVPFSQHLCRHLAQAPKQ